MRYATIAAAVLLAVTAPTLAQSESAPAAPQTENGASSGFDLSQLPALLGQVIESRSPTTPAPQTGQQPPAPFPGSSQSSRSSRHAAFRERLFQRRMALIDRLRSSAEQSGNPARVGQVNQLEAFVTQLHAEGLGAMMQRIGNLQGLAGGSASAEPAAPVDVPDVDFGESSPLPGVDFGEASPLPGAGESLDPPPRPAPEVEAPPALPPID